MNASLEAAPLVVHLLPQPDTGGGVHGVIKLIRHMPPGRYRHAIVCQSGEAACHRQAAPRGVEIISLNKRAGKDLGHYLRLFHALRALQPDLVHTRNLGGIEGQLVAALAGVKLRLHGEHGAPPSNPLLRRMLLPLIGHFIAVSTELERWLIDRVGAAPQRVWQIANGVDSVEFHPRLGPPAAVGPPGFLRDQDFVIGSVGTIDQGQRKLVDAFLRLIGAPHPAHQRLRLMIVGDGPLRANCIETLRRGGAAERAWLPGTRGDIAQLLRAMDLFVLPSPAEGGGTLLEAMASGLPVVATAVETHRALVQPGLTGMLVPPRAPELMAAAIADYWRIPEMAVRHGVRARREVIARHSLPAMARNYLAVYDALTERGC
ncbi:MAG: glycosyltransferase [Pseudomonadota bacterium]